MKKLIILFAIVILSSCTTQRKCLRKYPPQSSTITIIKDSIHTEIKYRDTTIYVNIPGETITNTVFVPVNSPGQNYIPDTARAENKYSIAKAWLDWPKIKLTLFQKPQIIEFQLSNAITERDTYRMLWEKEKSKEVVTVIKTRKFWVVTGSLFLFSAILALLLLSFRIRRTVLKR